VWLEAIACDYDADLPMVDRLLSSLRWLETH
jgi:hypothetical protein